MQRKFDNQTVKYIREMFLSGLSQLQLAKQFKVNFKTINNLLNLKTYLDEEAIPKYYNQRLLLRKKLYKNKKAKYPIILIGHKKRQGKDTFAQLLIEELAFRGVKTRKFAFADAMKDIVADMFDIDRNTLDYYKNKPERVVFDSQITDFRKLLQKFGSGKMKDIFGKSIWRDIVIKQFDKDSVNIVTDFRFPEEYIKGAFTIKVDRGVENNDEHISEKALDNFKFDYIVDNSGSLEDLNKEVKKVANLIIG